VTDDTDDLGAFDAAASTRVTMTVDDTEYEFDAAHVPALKAAFGDLDVPHPDTDRDYQWEHEYRDVRAVMQRLALDGEPVAVEMVGRNIAFKYPVPTGDGVDLEWSGEGDSE